MGWQQNQRRGARCLVSLPWGRLLAEGEWHVPLEKMLRAEHIGPFVEFWKQTQGRWNNRCCVFVTQLIGPWPDTAGSVRPRSPGWRHPLHSPPAHTLFRCAFQFLFHILRPQLSQSIATISAGYFLSHRKQHKQNHWKLRTGVGSVGRHCKRIKNHTAAPPVAAAAKWVLMCFFL